jgi:ribokinase
MNGPIVIGAINWDTTVFVKTFPGAGEEAVVQRIVEVPGGKGGNTAVAAARLLGRNRVAIFGGLGIDSIATEQIRIFEQEGLIVTGLKHVRDRGSGQAFIVVDETGENIIYTHFGANATVTPEDLDDRVRKDLIAQASVITIMDPPLETAIKLADMAKRFGKRVTYDPGVKSETGLTELQPILKNTDYIIANESEIRHLSGTDDSAKAAEMLRKGNAQLKVIAKLGGRGSIMFCAEGRTHCEALDLQANGMRVVSTVGCGDAFLGAFSAALSEDLSDLEALQWGSCAAGLKATRTETRGSPDREELLKHIGHVNIRRQP